MAGAKLGRAIVVEEQARRHRQNCAEEKQDRVDISQLARKASTNAGEVNVSACPEAIG